MCYTVCVEHYSLLIAPHTNNALHLFFVTSVELNCHLMLTVILSLPWLRLCFSPCTILSTLSKCKHLHLWLLHKYMHINKGWMEAPLVKPIHFHPVYAAEVVVPEGKTQEWGSWMSTCPRHPLSRNIDNGNKNLSKCADLNLQCAGSTASFCLALLTTGMWNVISGRSLTRCMRISSPLCTFKQWCGLV